MMKKIDLLWAVALMVSSVAVHAADYTWTTGTGNWTDTWDGGGYPATASDRAFITGGTQNLTPTYNPGTDLAAIEVKASAAGTTLNISEYIRTANNFVMSWNNTGTATVNHSANEFRSNGNVWLGGSGSASANIYNLTGTGILKTGASVLVARGDNSSATMNISGGTLDSWSGSTYIGEGSGSSGTVNLSAGALKQTGGAVYVGNSGSGAINQTGGKLWLDAGSATMTIGGFGTYTISGGEIALRLDRWAAVKDGGVFIVDGSGATSIEMSRLEVKDGGLVRINLDAGGSTLVKSSRSDAGQGLKLSGTLELDTMAGFNGLNGDVYDLFWAQTGNMETNGMTFVNLSNTEFVLRIVGKDGGDMLQAVIPSLDYEAWAATWGGDIGSETNDYDHDGVSNLYEFGLDGDPTNEFDQGTFLVYSMAEEGGSNVLRCVHPQRSDPGSGLVYSLLLSTNLVDGGWTTNSGYVTTGTNVTVGTLNFVTNTIGTIEDQKFIRLLIDNPSFTLWQLPSQGGKQMMSYVIESERGGIVVVDGGWEADGSYLRSFLAGRGYHVDAWFITHPHADHIEALTWILSNPGGTVIDHIYASFPPMEWFEEYAPSTAGTLSNFFAALDVAGKSYTDIEPGDLFDIDEIHIEILSVENTEITVNAVNNSSMSMQVSDPSKTVLFLGDLGLEGGDKLLGNIDHQKLRADYVQMAHHGQGAVSEAFYQVVHPDYCLWPTPLWLWNNDNGGGYDSGPWTTLETRQWMVDLNVQSNYVSGISGLIEIK